MRLREPLSVSEVLRGCDIIIYGPMHLTLKLDYLCGLSKSKLLPHGPRIYFGFLFYR